MKERDQAVDEQPLPAPAGLRGWFGKLKRRRWAALFLFEFMVVLLGVLAAQALQARFESQAERREAKRSLTALETNAETIGISAMIRMRGFACTQYRLRMIENAIATKSVPTVNLPPPEEVPITELGWDGTTPGVISEYFGAERSKTFANLQLWTEALRRAQISEQRSWSMLGRLSTRLGNPQNADFVAAKEGLVAAGQDLRRVIYAAGNIRNNLDRLGIKNDEDLFREYRGASDPCRAATGYTVEEHAAAARKGELVTGEPLPPPIDPSTLSF